MRDQTSRPYVSLKTIDMVRLRELWTTNLTMKAIAEKLGCAATTATRRALDAGLPRRPRMYACAPVKPHVAVVTRPAPTIEDRKDWPHLKAAIERAKGSKMPVKAVNIIAANFRLSPSVVHGLIHADTIARPGAIRADVKQRRGQE